ncbi:hypothetical protein, partial [Paraprevotella clara]|uniref:hypothetical protein n=1 Tax=Paraprevotella clara TaxID=454154 RepID=UPI00402A5DC6
EIFLTPGEGSVRGHDGIPERMPESSYCCYCLQKNMKIRIKRHYKIFCVNGKYGIHYGFCIFLF